VDRCSSNRVMRFTDNACKPSNKDRFLLRSLRGRSVQVLDKSVSALNCYFNYMIDHAKQGGYRMLLVFCLVALLRVILLRQTYVDMV
jgi:hypothetical protein